MSEPPACWDQQEEESASISSTTIQFGGLNMNALEFIPSFGPKATNVSIPAVPKTPPSTPVIPRHTNKNENLTLNRNQSESNDHQPMEEDFPIRGENQFMDDDNDRSFLIILILYFY
jgi:hypothetical protein